LRSNLERPLGAVAGVWLGSFFILEPQREHLKLTFFALERSTELLCNPEHLSENFFPSGVAASAAVSVYVEGRAGTLQEIFQDATQNFYRVLGDFSPMIFFGTRQWMETLPIVPVLQKLFKPEDFERYVCVTDEPATILKFLGEHSQAETPAQRMMRRRRA
jgi:hypothetical protein